ncbi:DUF1353 domain-containing protein [Sediminimonas qiaohouensis]|uniref:DUF1353 domain-containing protein n=1 Tax=Sediminimonas qiaohouensis TaxID=552061 RepID=UPI0004196166|nr:DUF1353 domain-containing protein [Sediminimonas qiaohouensis]
MSVFTQTHDWCAHENGVYRTTGTLRWEIGAKGSDLWVTVPVGFPFDVSIPRGLRWAFDPHDVRYLKAAALHDYAIHELDWPRVTAASLFSEALRAQGLGRLRRLVMVLAVIIWKFN